MSSSPSVPADPLSVVPPEPVARPDRGSFRFGRLLRTDIFVHWSWFVAAYFLIKYDLDENSSLPWEIAEYLAGFVLVLLHEFGHVLACRQVGGTANRVVLWPLGGLAFVAPPPRPWATLWTIVAGPLVNVVLAPVLLVLAFVTMPADEETASRLSTFITALAVFNVGLLIFNLLPIYPLDGGRILQAILWRIFGQSAGLMVAAIIGIIAGTGLGVLAVGVGEWWLAAMAAFLVLGAVNGVRQARLLSRAVQAARQASAAQPA